MSACFLVLIGDESCDKSTSLPSSYLILNLTYFVSVIETLESQMSFEISAFEILVSSA